MTFTLSNTNTGRDARFLHDDNEFGIIGIDHFAMPSLDVDLMARFIQEVLGGQPYYVVGYGDTDTEQGKRKQLFMRVGNVLMQCAEPIDGHMTIGKDDPNPWPHWAFTVSAGALDRNVARLKSMAIPVFGPAEHRGGDSVSAYFASPEGHKLELVTYEPYPEESTIGVFGSPGVGTPQWPQLFHDWPGESVSA